MIPTAAHLERFRAGEVLVTDKTDPDWEPTMKKASAIVTNRGGRTCHAAIVSRELGIPAIVGTENATQVLENGQPVTVSCCEGETGSVYAGLLPFEVRKVSFETLPRPHTKIMLNVGNPDEAFRLSLVPNDGVGLAREEFIITTYIKVHPLAPRAFRPDHRSGTRAEIDRVTAGYDDKPQFFVDKLAEGVATIAAAFYPKDVIVRLSDFKTNEYANLVGRQRVRAGRGKPDAWFSRRVTLLRRALSRRFCPGMPGHEEGPGRDGTYERQTHGPLLPHRRGRPTSHPRTGEERPETGRKWTREFMSCAKSRATSSWPTSSRDVFDGFSIGSNDLTQLVLGVDRDSEIVAPIFDERNQAVKSMIAHVIETAWRRAQNRHLRPGSQRLSRVCPIPGRTRDRQHLAQSRRRREDNVESA